MCRLTRCPFVISFLCLWSPVKMVYFFYFCHSFICLVAVLIHLLPTFRYVTLRAWRANEGGTTDLPDYSETVPRDRTLFENETTTFTLHPAMAHTFCWLLAAIHSLNVREFIIVDMSLSTKERLSLGIFNTIINLCPLWRAVNIVNCVGTEPLSV